MKKHMYVAVFAAALCGALLPASAYAASITNSIAVSPQSSALGVQVTITQTTSYAVGAVPVPYVSDFRTEIPASYWNRPSNIASNTNCGAWDTVNSANGEYLAKPYHVVQGANRWFYGAETWTLKSVTTSTAPHSYTQKMVHGQQESDSAVSQGTRATVWTKVY